MYAIVKTGGKQYRVEKGQKLLVERLAADEGASVKLGAPLLKGGKVTGTIVRHGKGAKVSVVKFKRRAHYLRQKTHRQIFTEVKITDISAGPL